MSPLYVESRGHGAVQVILLHGWAMHGGLFAPLTQALAQRATVHVVDLPGHGYSRGSRVPLEPVACARAIAATTPPGVWLGWSLGGLIALASAIEQPNHVHALAMVCSSPCFVRRDDWACGMAPPVFADFGRELGSDYHATMDRFLALEAMGSARAREAMRQLRADVYARGEPDPRVLREGLEMLKHTDLRAGLTTLAQPSVWIAGARDRLVPWQAMHAGAGMCGGRFHCIAHAGHAPFIGFVDEVASALEPLLATCDASRKRA